ncbi:MAG: hypothetical protein BWY85_02137 [Firmicutes bacterium ADurb.Bin506]|nr:MAG: hypothetical protein BWY85_02137 [Firmicutes bacterium ADurb.Bin506]
MSASGGRLWPLSDAAATAVAAVAAVAAASVAANSDPAPGPVRPSMAAARARAAPIRAVEVGMPLTAMAVEPKGSASKPKRLRVSMFSNAACISTGARLTIWGVRSN